MNETVIVLLALICGGVLVVMPLTLLLYVVWKDKGNPNVK